MRQQVGDDLSKKWMDNKYFEQFSINMISSASFLCKLQKVLMAGSTMMCLPDKKLEGCAHVLNSQRDLRHLEATLST